MNLNLIEERARLLLDKVNSLLALGESGDAMIVQHREGRWVVLDTKILCYEFGNKAIIEIIEARNAHLPECRKALEKVLDTVPLRRQPAD